MSPKPLLGLPLELRQLIYHHALVRDSHDPQRPAYVYSLAPPALLKVNRQIREEAVPVFYGRNFFFIDLDMTVEFYVPSSCDVLDAEPSEKQTTEHSETQSMEPSGHIIAEADVEPIGDLTENTTEQQPSADPAEQTMEQSGEAVEEQSDEDSCQYWHAMCSTLGHHFKHITRLWLAQMDCDMPEYPDYEIGLKIIDSTKSKYTFEPEPNSKNSYHPYHSLRLDDVDAFCAHFQGLFEADFGWFFVDEEEASQYPLWYAIFVLLTCGNVGQKSLIVYWRDWDIINDTIDNENEGNLLSHGNSWDFHDYWYHGTNCGEDSDSDNDTSWMYDDCASNDFDSGDEVEL